METVTSELGQAADAKAQQMVEEWRYIVNSQCISEKLLADLLSIAFIYGATWYLKNVKG